MHFINILGLNFFVIEKNPVKIIKNIYLGITMRIIIIILIIIIYVK